MTKITTSAGSVDAVMTHTSSTIVHPDGLTTRVTHDVVAHAGYLYLHADADVHSDFQVDLGHGVILDYAADGSLRGVENYNGPVTEAVLAYVLRRLNGAQA